MKTKHARLIRIGINARCLPYMSEGDSQAGYWVSVDYPRVQAYKDARQLAHSKLTERAFLRTRPWVSGWRAAITARDLPPLRPMTPSPAKGLEP